MFWGRFWGDPDYLPKYCISFAQYQGVARLLPFVGLRVSCVDKFLWLAGAANSNCSEDCGRLVRDGAGFGGMAVDRG